MQIFPCAASCSKVADASLVTPLVHSGVRSGYPIRRFLYGQIYQLAGKPIFVLYHVTAGTMNAPAESMPDWLSEKLCTEPGHALTAELGPLKDQRSVSSFSREAINESTVASAKHVVCQNDALGCSDSRI